jgi:hypothetical protein
LPLIPDFQTAPSKEGACVNSELMAKQQEMAIKGVNRDTLPRGISVLNESKQLHRTL